MGGISRALALEQQGDYRSAVKSLMSVLDDIEASSEWDSVCEWIAGCFEKIGEHDEAGFWYETAAQLSLAGDIAPLPRRVSEALFFLQKASNCYSKCGSEGAMASARTKAISVVLERSCPPA
jgi:tetratricopeptide (TPR) repeat protein